MDVIDRKWWTSRNFRLFLGGQAISMIGSLMQDTALPWLVLQLTGSPTHVGLLVFCRYMPFLLFGLFSGTLAANTQSILQLEAPDRLRGRVISLFLLRLGRRGSGQRARRRVALSRRRYRAGTHDCRVGRPRHDRLCLRARAPLLVRAHGRPLARAGRMPQELVEAVKQRLG